MLNNNSNSLLVFVCMFEKQQCTHTKVDTEIFWKLDFMRSDGGHHSVIEQICKYFSILSSNLSNGKTHEHGELPVY